MTVECFRSSRPDPCVLPRAHSDESHRRRTYGKIQPMPEPIRYRLNRGVTKAALVVAAIVLLGIVQQVAEFSLRNVW